MHLPKYSQSWNELHELGLTTPAQDAVFALYRDKYKVVPYHYVARENGKILMLGSIDSVFNGPLSVKVLIHKNGGVNEETIRVADMKTQRKTRRWQDMNHLWRYFVCDDDAVPRFRWTA